MNSNAFYVVDRITGKAGFQNGTASQIGSNSVTDLDLSANSDPYTIVVRTPDTCVLTGAGNDVIWGLSGNNLVDAGSGMNFIFGSKSGNDTFVVDSAAKSTSDTIVGFHHGDCINLDAATDMGWTLNWTNSVIGTVLHATDAVTHAAASITFQGIGSHTMFTTGIGGGGFKTTIAMT